ncbi:hypothetical protein PICMEDRAFT_17141 [Pichia membranifaciens NRRL Y-2026]|uniref:Ribosome biogenesis protein ALB1 n=1 Tax=Pichia membranifaciens NRRL Y-2026 TaxID=763406 RepID=A0A1E3NJX6_9ASCO|nr:hypothetical protein PICMEDRAFT_17141 [Pichia membranifaciens NRRL Y-2026]ODQ45878.1 hypothetical protein PICMEDRAFT_17141 [Pichia membranifaciens NRRL Y-2026]
MPSKNSINKPKDNMIRQRKSLGASKRRQRRSQQSVTMIQTSNGSTAVVPVVTVGGVITNRVISNKKARKVERNLKYAQLRRDGAVHAKRSSGGDVEMADEGAAARSGKTSGAKESAVRKALWTVVEDAKVSGVPVAVAAGEGTTLGGPSF